MDGKVHINGTGIPTITQPKGATSYSFTGILISGTFRSANGGTFVGLIKITTAVTGSSPSENTLGGSGTVNSFPVAATTKVVGNLSGSCAGKFKRTLSVVIVNLSCPISVQGKPVQTGKVTVVAYFQPTGSGNGVTSRVTDAQFAGVYASQ